MKASWECLDVIGWRKEISRLIPSFLAFTTEMIELTDWGGISCRGPEWEEWMVTTWSLRSMNLVSSTLAVLPFLARNPPWNPGHWVAARGARCETYILNCLKLNFVYTSQLTISTYFKHFINFYFLERFFLSNFMECWWN